MTVLESQGASVSAADELRIAAAAFEMATPTILTDGRGRILRVNQAFCALTGYSAAEVIGETPAILKSGKHDTSFYRALWAELVATGRWQGDLWNRRKTGELFREKLSICAVRDDDGAVTHYVGTLVDITDQMKTSRSLAAATEREAQLLAALGEAVYGVDLDGRCTFINQAGLSLLGYERDEVIGNDPHALFHHSHADGTPYPAHDCPVRQVLRSGERWEGEEWFFKRDGSGVAVWVIVTPLLSNGALQGAVVAFHDITERKAAEDKLFLERRRLENVISGTRAGTWEWNVQTGETVFNERWAEIVGETLDSLAPISIQTWLDLTHPDDLKTSGDHLEKHFSGQSPYYECEVRMRHKDGHWVWIFDRGRVVEWTEDGKPLWMAGTHIDVTERVRVRESLTERERLYRLAQTATGVGVWDWDVAADVVRWDAACWSMLGYPVPQLPMDYVDWLGRLHPEDAQAAQDAFQKTMQAGGGFVIEYRCRKADGEWLWVQARGQVVDRGKDGRPLRVMGSHTPVQDAKEAQLRLTDIADRLGRLARHLPGVIYQYRLYPDGRSRFPYASEGISLVYGCQPEDVRLDASPVFQVIHADDLDWVGEGIKASARDLTPWRAEYRVNHPDKGLIWVEGHATPQAMPDGGVLWHGYIADVTEHKGLEQEIAERERLYRTIVEHVSDAIFLVEADADGSFRYLKVNPSVARLFGLQEVVGKTPHDIFAPDVADRMVARNDACLRDRRIISYEEDLDLPAGRRTLATMLNPIVDGDGRVSRIVGISRDVTEAKAEERAVRRSEARLRSLFEVFPDGVLLLDPETGKASHFNPPAHRQLGYNADEFARLAIQDYESLESPEEVVGHIQKVMDEGRDTFETRQRRKDGTEIDVLVSVSRIEVDGQTQLLAVFRDVTESRRLQAEAMAARERLDSYFRLAPLGIYVTDPEGRYVEVNPEACAQSGFSVEDFQAMTIEDYVWPEDREIGLAHFRQVQETGKAVGEVRFRRKDGGWFWASVLAGFLPDGKAIGFVEEISARKRMQEALERSNKELEQFAYVVSHDLRQPLRMISSYGQLIDRALGPDASERTREFLAYVRDGAVRMDQMLVALLDYSRVGRMGEPISEVPSRDLIQEALRYLDPVIHDRAAEITLEGSWPVILVSRNEGVRLFQNVLGNALKYCPPDRAPHIRVGVEPEVHGWVFSVTDNGIGIEPRHQDRLFGVFQRLHTRQEYEGTGIGLAVCRRIVERHGGRIWVESTGEGAGSTFRFFLPHHPPREGGEA